MTVDEIYGNIRYNENLIDQFQRERRDLERQIAELESLRDKFSVLQMRFEERQNSRRRGLQLFQSSSIHNQIVGRYVSGMTGLLSGWEFQNACWGLEEARERIKRKLWELDRKADECSDRISYRHARRNYWISQLHAALAAEEGE